MSDDESNNADGRDRCDSESKLPGPKFSYIDFWPKCLEKGGLMKAPVFEDFSECLERANVFLKVNLDWEVINCETVERKQDADDEEVEAETMTYNEDSKRVQCFVTGLRLWVRVKEDPDAPPQRLGYVNFLPKADPLSSKQKYPNFATHVIMLQDINTELQSNPIEGKIITIETRDIKYRGYWTDQGIDPDQNAWFQLGNDILYLTTVRVFYEHGEPRNETIGFEDLVPDKTGSERVGLGKVAVATYGNYASLMAKGQAWLKDRRDVRVTNIQTIQRKIKKIAMEIDMHSTSFVDGKPSDKVFISSLRIAYVTAPNQEEQPSSEAHHTIDADGQVPCIDLRQRTIYPSPVLEGRTAMKQYVTDSLKQTVVEALPWFNRHQSCRVLSVQTLLAPVLKHVKEPHVNTCDRFLTKQEWFQIYLRVYFDATDDDGPSSDENEDEVAGDNGATDPEEKKDCCIQ